MSIPPLHLPDDVLAEAEERLELTWTETGFSVRLPTIALRLGRVAAIGALITALLGVSIATVFSPVVMALYLAAGIVVAARLSQAGGGRITHAPEASRVPITAEGDTLQIGNRSWPLAEIDMVLFVNGGLRIRRGRERWLAVIPDEAHAAVQRVLVRMIDHAIARARERVPHHRRTEKAARGALEGLRERSGEAER